MPSCPAIQQMRLTIVAQQAALQVLRCITFLKCVDLVATSTMATSTELQDCAVSP